MKDDIVYFELNNWLAGRDYPNEEPFSTWVKMSQFSDDNWCKENELCVARGYIDMSYNWVVGAKRSWIEKNCPKLLTDGEYEYQLIQYGPDGEKTITYTRKYSDFLVMTEDGDLVPKYGFTYVEYKPENYGSHWHDYDYNEEEGDENRV